MYNSSFNKKPTQPSYIFMGLDNHIKSAVKAVLKNPIIKLTRVHLENYGEQEYQALLGFLSV